MSRKNKIIEFLFTIPLVNWLIRRSKTTTLPGFTGIPIYQVVAFFIRQVQTIGMTERASAIAFNFVMAIPPAIIFLFTLIPYLPITRSLQQELYRLIKDIIPGERNNAVLINFLQDFINNPRNGLLSIGFILSLYFSSNAMMGIMRSFDKNYAGFKKRTNWQRRKAAIQLTVLLYLFVMASLVALIARDVVLEWLGIENASLRTILSNLRWAVIFEYAPELEAQINNLVEVERDSEAEIELRASSIYCIARLTEEINKRRPGMVPLLMPQVDFRFWKTYHATHWPHHLTHTIMY